MAKETERIKNKRSTQKKSSSAYPKFSFRIDSETKEELSAIVDSIYCHYLDRKDDKHYTVKKNDIIIDALRIGLEKIEKDLKNLPLLKPKELSLSEWQRRNPKPRGKGNTIF